MAGEGVGNGQHVPMEMHRRLGHPGGARGRREHHHVVCGGVRVGERAGHRLALGRKIFRTCTAVGHRGQCVGDPRQLLAKSVVAQRERGFRQLDELAQLVAAQQRHRGDHHAACLDDAEPAGHQPRVVRSAQQHPAAREKSVVLGEYLCDLVGPSLQLAVGPPLRRRDQAGTVGAERGDLFVQQGGRAVQPRRVSQLVQRHLDVRPQLARGQVIPTEGVQMCRR